MTGRFSHLIAFVQCVSEGGSPEVQAKADDAITAIQAEEVKIEAEITDLQERVSALEADADALDAAAGGADSILGAAGANTIVGSIGDDSLTATVAADTLAAAAANDAVTEPLTSGQTAEITPIDPTDPLRAGAGTSVTSPAPAAVPQSAEPIPEETPAVAS